MKKKIKKKIKKATVKPPLKNKVIRQAKFQRRKVAFNFLQKYAQKVARIEVYNDSDRQSFFNFTESACFFKNITKQPSKIKTNAIEHAPILRKLKRNKRASALIKRSSFQLPRKLRGKWKKANSKRKTRKKNRISRRWETYARFRKFRKFRPYKTVEKATPALPYLVGKYDKLFAKSRKRSLRWRAPSFLTEPERSLSRFSYDVQHVFLNQTHFFEQKPFLRKGKKTFLERLNTDRKYRDVRKMATTKKALVNLPMTYRILRNKATNQIFSLAGKKMIRKRKKIMFYLRKKLARARIKEKIITYKWLQNDRPKYYERKQWKKTDYYRRQRYLPKWHPKKKVKYYEKPWKEQNVREKLETLHSKNKLLKGKLELRPPEENPQLVREGWYRINSGKKNKNKNNYRYSVQGMPAVPQIWKKKRLLSLGILRKNKASQPAHSFVYQPKKRERFVPRLPNGQPAPRYWASKAEKKQLKDAKAKKEELGIKPRYVLNEKLRDVENSVGSSASLGYTRARAVFINDFEINNIWKKTNVKMQQNNPVARLPYYSDDYKKKFKALNLNAHNSLFKNLFETAFLSEKIITKVSNARFEQIKLNSADYFLAYKKYCDFVFSFNTEVSEKNAAFFSDFKSEISESEFIVNFKIWLNSLLNVKTFFKTRHTPSFVDQNTQKEIIDTGLRHLRFRGQARNRKTFDSGLRAYYKLVMHPNFQKLRGRHLRKFRVVKKKEMYRSRLKNRFTPQSRRMHRLTKQQNKNIFTPKVWRKWNKTLFDKFFVELYRKFTPENQLIKPKKTNVDFSEKRRFLTAPLKRLKKCFEKRRSLLRPLEKQNFIFSIRKNLSTKIYNRAFLRSFRHFKKNIRPRILSRERMAPPWNIKKFNQQKINARGRSRVLWRRPQNAGFERELDSVWSIKNLGFVIPKKRHFTANDYLPIRPALYSAKTFVYKPKLWRKNKLLLTKKAATRAIKTKHTKTRLRTNRSFNKLLRYATKIKKIAAKLKTKRALLTPHRKAWFQKTNIGKLKKYRYKKKIKKLTYKQRKIKAEFCVQKDLKQAQSFFRKRRKNSKIFFAKTVRSILRKHIMKENFGHKMKKIKNKQKFWKNITKLFTYLRGSFRFKSFDKRKKHKIKRFWFRRITYEEKSKINKHQKKEKKIRVNSLTKKIKHRSARRLNNQLKIKTFVNDQKKIRSNQASTIKIISKQRRSYSLTPVTFRQTTRIYKKTAKELLTILLATQELRRKNYALIAKKIENVTIMFPTLIRFLMLNRFTEKRYTPEECSRAVRAVYTGLRFNFSTSCNLSLRKAKKNYEQALYLAQREIKTTTASQNFTTQNEKATRFRFQPFRIGGRVIQHRRSMLWYKKFFPFFFSLYREDPEEREHLSLSKSMMFALHAATGGARDWNSRKNGKTVEQQFRGVTAQSGNHLRFENALATSRWDSASFAYHSGHNIIVKKFENKAKNSFFLRTFSTKNTTKESVLNDSNDFNFLVSQRLEKEWRFKYMTHAVLNKKVSAAETLHFYNKIKAKAIEHIKSKQATRGWKSKREKVASLIARQKSARNQNYLLRTNKKSTLSKAAVTYTKYLQKYSQKQNTNNSKLRQSQNYPAIFVSNSNLYDNKNLTNFRKSVVNKRTVALHKIIKIDPLSKSDTSKLSILHFRHPRTRSVRFNFFPRLARILPSEIHEYKENVTYVKLASASAISTATELQENKTKEFYIYRTENPLQTVQPEFVPDFLPKTVQTWKNQITFKEKILALGKTLRKKELLESFKSKNNLKALKALRKTWFKVTGFWGKKNRVIKRWLTRRLWGLKANGFRTMSLSLFKIRRIRLRKLQWREQDETRFERRDQRRKYFRFKSEERKKAPWLEGMIYPRTLLRTKRGQDKRYQTPSEYKSNKWLQHFRKAFATRNPRAQYLKKRRWPKLRISNYRMHLSMFDLRNSHAAHRRFVKISRKRTKESQFEQLMRGNGNRLDVTLILLKLMPTVFWAKAAATHGLINVNGKTVRNPAFRLKAGDVIKLRPGTINKFRSFFEPPRRRDQKPRLELTSTAGISKNFEYQHKILTAFYRRLPSSNDIPDNSRLNSRRFELFCHDAGRNRT